MNRIKILYLINSLNVGGTEKRVAALLQRLPRDTFNPRLCCLVEAGALEKSVRDAGVEIEVLGYKGVRVNKKLSPIRILQFPGLFLKFHQYLKRERFDLMHTFLPICNTIGAVVGRGAGVPFIIGSRVCLGEYRDANPLYQPIENFASHRTDAVICNSKMVYEDVLKREKIEPEKLKVIYNGVDVDKFDKLDKSAAAKKIREEFNIPNSSPIIGIVANLYKYKGIEYFIDAAKLALLKIPDIFFIIVGRDFGMLAMLKSQAESLGISERIIFTGFREDVPELISSFDILTLTSLEEGMPNSLLEGMSARKPIITANAGGAVEVVEDGKTGFIIPMKKAEPLAEKIIALLENPALRISMGESGYQRAREIFSFEKMLSSYVDVYRSFFK